MASITVTMTFASTEEMLSFFGGKPAVSTPIPSVLSASGQPLQPALPSTPAAPNAGISLQPPAMQAASTTASPSNDYTLATLAPLMQAYHKAFGMAGTKAVFAKMGVPPELPKLNQQQLNEAAGIFAAMQPV